MPGRLKLTPKSRMGDVTFDEFCQRVREDQKADLIDGVIYMASPENVDANELFLWLAGLMFDFVQYHELGKVYGSRVAFRLEDKTAPEPDIAFVRKSREHLIERGGVYGAPDLAVCTARHRRRTIAPDAVRAEQRPHHLPHHRGRPVDSAHASAPARVQRP